MYYIVGSVLVGFTSRKVMAAKITTFFRIDGPLPLRWTPSPEPPKKSKRRPGRDFQLPEVIVTFRQLSAFEVESHSFIVV